MTHKEIEIILARINEELGNISLLMDELKSKRLLGDKDMVSIQGDSFFMRSIGSVLHDFYVAVENTLRIICSEIDEKIPEGPQWHVLLLKQATYEINGIRPAVISKRTAQKLDKYRSFRHVFRNVYGFHLDLSRINELLLELPETVDLFTNDLKCFTQLIKS